MMTIAELDVIISELEEKRHKAHESHQTALKVRDATHAEWTVIQNQFLARQEEEKKQEQRLYQELRRVEEDLNLAYANHAAATCIELITPDMLRAELKQAINTQAVLDTSVYWNQPLEDSIIHALEISQITHAQGLDKERLMVEKVVYITAAGTRRHVTLQKGQLERVWDVLTARCPMRADSQKRATPYPLKNVDGRILPALD